MRGEDVIWKTINCFNEIRREKNIVMPFRENIVEECINNLNKYDMNIKNRWNNNYIPNVLMKVEEKLFMHILIKNTKDENEIDIKQVVSILELIIHSRLSKKEIDMIDNLRKAYINSPDYVATSKMVYEELVKIKTKLDIKKVLIEECNERVVLKCDYIDASYNLIYITLAKKRCKRSFKLVMKEILKKLERMVK